MKKLILFAAAAAMTVLGACNSKTAENNADGEAAAQEDKFPEKFDKKISGVSWTSDIQDALIPCMGQADFSITKEEGDSVDFTVEIPVKADNKHPVTSVEDVTCYVYYSTSSGVTDICKEAQLAPDQTATIMEMCKKADPNDEVKIKFNGRTSTALMDSLVNSAENVGFITYAKMK